MDSELNQQVSLSDNDLYVVQFDSSKHTFDLHCLFQMRELDQFDHYIPKLGFCVYNKANVAVSFLFIREIEGKAAMLDSMITNPTCSAEIRDKANNLVIGACIDYLKQAKTKIILAFTKDKNTLVRTCSHGLSFLEGYQVVVANFAKEP